MFGTHVKCFIILFALGLSFTNGKLIFDPIKAIKETVLEIVKNEVVKELNPVANQQPAKEEYNKQLILQFLEKNLPKPIADPLIFLALKTDSLIDDIKLPKPIDLHDPDNWREYYLSLLEEIAVDVKDILPDEYYC